MTASRELRLEKIDRGRAVIERLARSGPPRDHLRREIARAASDALERLLPEGARPELRLTSGDLERRMASAEVEIAPDAPGRGAAMPLGFDVVRGRHGARAIARPDAALFRGAWPLAPGRAASIREGDMFTCFGRSWRASYAPAPPRPLVEIASTRWSRGDVAALDRFEFALEPGGGRIVLALGEGVARAIADALLVAGGAIVSSQAPRGEIERAVVAWGVRLVAEEVSGVVFHGEASLVPRDGTSERPPFWLTSVVRVAAHCGAAYLGVDEEAMATIGGVLAPIGRRLQIVQPVVRRIEALVSARIPFGETTLGAFAGVEVGDVVLAVESGPRSATGDLGDGELVVHGAETAPVAARFVREGSIVRACVGTGILTARSVTMKNGSFDGAVGGEETPPFASVLDEMTVSLAVEIARRRIPLAELLALSPGDVVEMNAPLAASVALVVDGAVFARGELVDVEGVLGVRITSIGRRP